MQVYTEVQLTSLLALSQEPKQFTHQPIDHLSQRFPYPDKVQQVAKKPDETDTEYDYDTILRNPDPHKVAVTLS
jgi:hypothetical protein